MGDISNPVKKISYWFLFELKMKQNFQIIASRKNVINQRGLMFTEL